MEDNMLQSNLTFHWPAQESHCKQSVQGTAITATTRGSAPCEPLVRMMSLSTNGSLELVFIGHPSVQSQTHSLLNYIYVKNIKCFRMDFAGKGSRILLALLPQHNSLTVPFQTGPSLL